MRIVNQRTEMVPLGAVAPHPRNINQGNIGLIGESISHNGFYGSLVVQQSTGHILRGNHTWQAARQAGATEIPVTYVDVDDETALRILLVDNRATREGTDDSNALAVLLQELAATPAGLEGSGYDGDALNELLADLGAQQPEIAGDPDAVPEVPAEPISRPGDLWVLGEHRLLCGNALTDMPRLLEGVRPDMVFTDPPYNCADEMSEAFYSGCNSPSMKTLSVTDWDKGFDIVPFLAALSHVRPTDGTVYISTSHQLAPAIWRWMAEDGAKLTGYCVWCKPNPMPSMAKRHWTWAAELVCYATWGKHTFNFPASGHALNWWGIPCNAANKDHPTQKPVALVEHALAASSNAGAVVLDPFGGAGTTLLACEKMGRRACLCEIEPRYVDVSVRRWEEYTGRTAVREPAPAAAEASDHARVPAGA